MEINFNRIGINRNMKNDTNGSYFCFFRQKCFTRILVLIGELSITLWVENQAPEFIYDLHWRQISFN